MIIMLKSGNGQNFFIKANLTSKIAWNSVVIKRVDCSSYFTVNVLKFQTLFSYQHCNYQNACYNNKQGLP